MTQQDDDLTALLKMTHSPAALIAAAIADQQLQDGLLLKMPKISRDMRDRLFDGYGPLNSFAAKTDIAFALGCIDKLTFDRLTMIRKVRNIFAHSDEFVTFEHPEVLSLMAPFGLTAEHPEPQIFFVLQGAEVEKALIAAFGPSISKPSLK